ncbi:hypothetical protein, conserved [Trypanosoma brucei gambiense DAL972]|uniref:Sperm microtubule inner protein 1 C-terminal domain-containing protein n=2 Tax=Trypanosoma brucei TaxID=5691 RepID=C9ZNZ9_TRYB9|nr:hypothetical protein, conserved [Trypanosoma brucei gambiense DAL972]RHW72591.1 hypothetical protein DPX39_050025400 [Trypanosoma brucei equiperdum]CBH11127.1 hypothetical protein, conserved [Trypanosoma brucei gambiense DAL972]|eukprot:XP_011773414.1 hypothetical protein, conserved [Trypanosoma brucei gambiense DAL972]
MPKKKPPCPSVTPQLYEKSHKPSVTVGMGMKGSAASTACWRDQVDKEEQLHAIWAKRYDRRSNARLVESLKRTLQREKDSAEQYRKDNDALNTILFSKDVSDAGRLTTVYLKARNRLAPQEKYLRAQTAAQEVGWGIPEAMRGGDSVEFTGTPALPRLTKASAMAYRRPDDEDHAELFGYTLMCSFCGGKP